MLHPRAVERQRQRNRRLGHLLDQFERGGLLVLRDLGDVVERCGGNTCSREPVEQVAARQRADARLQQRGELLAALEPVGVRREARVDGELGDTDRVAEPSEEPVVRRRDHDVAVACTKDLVRRDQRERRPVPRRDFSRA